MCHLCVDNTFHFATCLYSLHVLNHLTLDRTSCNFNMRAIHVISFLVFLFYLYRHASSLAAEQNQSTADFIPGNPRNNHYNRSNSIINDLLNQTGTAQELSSKNNLHGLLKTYGANVCHKSNVTKEIDLLILVDSIAEHADKRERIRATWYSYWVNRMENVDVVFFVGKPLGSSMDEKLARENGIHNDLVWSNTIDFPIIYGTIKAMAWLQWLIKKCNNAKMVLKIDENVILNVPKMLKFVLDNHKTVNTIWGSEHTGEEPQPFRYLLKDAYLMPRDVITKLFYGGLKPLPYIAQESTYLTGLVASKENIEVVNIPQFKAVQLIANYSSPIPEKLKSLIEDCSYYRDQLIFLQSKNKDDWLYLLLTFSTCPK